MVNSFGTWHSSFIIHHSSFLLLLVALLPSLAAAETRSPCPEEVRRWVSAAAQDLGFELEPRECHGPLLRVRVHPPDAPLLDVEVAEPPGPAFRRAGRLRVSPIVEVADYDLLPAGQRRDFEALVGWLSEHESRVAFVSSPSDGSPGRVSLFGLRHLGPWLVVAALVLCWIGHRRRHLPSSEALLVCCVFGVALALRLTFGIWGPHHINGQGPLWIRGALDAPDALSAYGPGYHEVFSWVAALGGDAPDLVLFAINAVLSSLVSVVLYVLARDLDLDPMRAVLAASLWAVDPITVRFAASEGYFTVIVFLTLCASTCLVTSTERLHRDGVSLRSIALALAGGLLTAQVARIHPVAWVPIALAPLLVLATREHGIHASRRMEAAVIAVLVTGVIIWLVSGDWVRVVAHGTPSHFAGSPIDRAVSAIPWTAVPCLAATGALIVWISRRRWLTAVVLASVIALIATHDVYSQHELWQASYHRLFAPAILLGVAGLIPRRMLGWRVLVPTVVVSTLSCAAIHWPAIAERTTEQREYAFLRERIADLAPGCRVAHVARAGLRVVEVPSHLPVIRIETPGDLDAALGAGTCLYYLHTSICSSAEGREPCDAVESALVDPTKVAHARFPAVPSYTELPYDRPVVEVVIWRLVRPERGSQAFSSGRRRSITGGSMSPKRSLGEICGQCSDP
jgi:hypothetical protein